MAFLQLSISFFIAYNILSIPDFITVSDTYCLLLSIFSKTFNCSMRLFNTFKVLRFSDMGFHNGGFSFSQ